MTEEEYQETHAYIGSKDLGPVPLAHLTGRRDHEAQKEAAQVEAIRRGVAEGLATRLQDLQDELLLNVVAGEQPVRQDGLSVEQGGKDLVGLAVSQQEAAQVETEQAEELAARLQKLLAGGHTNPLRINPEIMVHGHTKQGEPEAVTIYKSDPGDDDVSELYQTAVQVDDVTHIVYIDFRDPGMSEEILLAIVHDRLVSGHYSSDNVHFAINSIKVALAYLR